MLDMNRVDKAEESRLKARLSIIPRSTLRAD